MAWRESGVMDARLSFIAACLRGDEAISRVCERFGISRKTGHKWLARYHAAGAVCLMPRSSARHTQGHRIDEATAARVIALRAAHPTWGPRKLRARLSLDEPETAWPAASTIGDLLRRSGHVRPRRQRRAPMLGKKRELTQATAANMVWSADFKGWFRTGDGVRCEALTITDSYSRYVLCCQALPQVTFAVVRSAMIRVFEAHGLPAVLRTDNGNPFARRDSLCGLTQFSVWLLLLGVRPEMIVPGRPDMNGRHERMHRVVHEDTARPPAQTLLAQQRRFDLWRTTYNTLRPHEALGQRCPATLYAASPRPYPSRLGVFAYPSDHQRRKVIGDGYITWRGGSIYLTAALIGQTVALAQRDDGDWAVRFCGFDLAVISDVTNRLVSAHLRPTAVVSVLADDTAQARAG